MKLKVNIAARLLVTVLLLFFQIGLLVTVWLRFVNWLPIVSTVFNLMNIFILLFLVWKNDDSGYKVAWILIVALLPVAGGLLYLLFGTKRPAKKLQKALKREHQISKDFLAQNATVKEEIAAGDERAASLVSYINNTMCYPAYGNTVTEYYAMGEDMYAAMLAALQKAEHFIFMEYFIIQGGKMWDGILDILTKKAAAGVDIRLLYDDAGSLALLPSNFAGQMQARGIQCVAFNKVVPFLALRMNNRDHRKIMVIDGHTAFNGGLNIADEYINEKKLFGVWKDTGLMLKGDAVWGFTMMFLETWNAVSNDRIPRDMLNSYRPTTYGDSYIANGYVQPYPDTPLDENAVGENVYIDILNQATKYVYVLTPYLIIGDQMKAALALAGKRGVDVRIVTPGIPDKKIVYRQTRSYYKQLIAAGVRIYEYTPGFLHAKSFVSDDRVGVVGTINLDYRSLYLHFECGTLIMGTDTVRDLARDMAETLAQSREVTLADCERGFFGSLLDAVVRVFAPLL